MIDHSPSFICMECGKTTEPKERHTYLDCLRHKFRSGRLTAKDTAQLFLYAEKGELAWEAEREAKRERVP